MGTVGAEYLSCQPLFSIADELKSIGVPEKKLASMNIEELLKGVAAAGSSSSDDDEVQQQEQEQQPHSVPPTVGIKKSVEEVWRDIQRGKSAENLILCHDPQQQQEDELDEQTLGEMTLEEFLVKSGVVKGEPSTPTAVDNGHKRDRDEEIFMHGFEDTFKRMKPCDDCSPRLAHPPSFALVDPTICLRSKGDEYLDKAAERRQKRMIKNRESAARSRARKQAYTAELEAEVTHLKEENETLKRHKAEDERWRTKMLDVLTTLKRAEDEQVTTHDYLKRASSV